MINTNQLTAVRGLRPGIGEAKSLATNIRLDSISDKSLTIAVRVWFAVTLAGQLLFAFVTASFYGLTTVRGNLQAWNKLMPHGYVAGQPAGNFAVGLHLASAVIILLAGGLQFVPQFRRRFPAIHRWSGRVYILSAVGLTIGGLYIHWVRGTVGGMPVRIGSTLNAILIWLCAAMAMRYAIARDFRAHRRWALRLFLVVSASWFIRVAFALTLLIFGGPVGFDPSTNTGPFLNFMAFAQYLVPLAILELYLRTQDRPGSARRFAMSALFLVLTLGTLAGTAAVSAGSWIPRIRTAYDSRKSINEALAATIATKGIEEAVRQYHALKASDHGTWNFDESELNSLGYQFARAHRMKEAIRIFQLNVEAYPQSANTYDSLGEAFLDDGNTSQAIVNYRESLRLNPKSRGAMIVLEKLHAH